MISKNITLFKWFVVILFGLFLLALGAFSYFVEKNLGRASYEAIGGIVVVFIGLLPFIRKWYSSPKS